MSVNLLWGEVREVFPDHVIAIVAVALGDERRVRIPLTWFTEPVTVGSTITLDTGAGVARRAEEREP